MPKGSYSKKVSDARVMLAGIKSNKESLISRGINDEYIETFEKLTASCVELNNKQEKAKADLVNLTDQLNDMVDELEKEYQFCKRAVMTEIPSTKWKEFGMQYRYKGPKSPSDDNQDNEDENNSNDNPETTD